MRLCISLASAHGWRALTVLSTVESLSPDRVRAAVYQSGVCPRQESTVNSRPRPHAKPCSQLRHGSALMRQNPLPRQEGTTPPGWVPPAPPAARQRGDARQERVLARSGSKVPAANTPAWQAGLPHPGRAPNALRWRRGCGKQAAAGRLPLGVQLPLGVLPPARARRPCSAALPPPFDPDRCAVTFLASWSC